MIFLSSNQNVCRFSGQPVVGHDLFIGICLPSSMGISCVRWVRWFGPSLLAVEARAVVLTAVHWSCLISHDLPDNGCPSNPWLNMARHDGPSGNTGPRLKPGKHILLARRTGSSNPQGVALFVSLRSTDILTIVNPLLCAVCYSSTPVLAPEPPYHSSKPISFITVKQR